MKPKAMGLDDLLEAAKELSPAEKVLLRNALDLTIDENELMARLDVVVHDIRKRSAEYSEEEIAADVKEAILQVKEARRRSGRA